MSSTATPARPEVPALQQSLFGYLSDDGADDPADVPGAGRPERVGVGPLRPVRTPLSDGAWVDTCPGWVRGADALFERLVGTVPWRAERRRMYERVVEVPRLLAWYGAGAVLPHPVLDELKAALDEYYGDELGEQFATAGLCLYRDGRDSVAWHGDYVARDSMRETMVAIVSLGCPRTLALRPRAGGSQQPRHAVRQELGHGDLLVMGGTCQRTWEHAVPKTTRPVGPRISIQFRPYDVR